MNYSYFVSPIEEKSNNLYIDIYFLLSTSMYIRYLFSPYQVMVLARIQSQLFVCLIPLTLFLDTHNNVFRVGVLFSAQPIHMIQMSSNALQVKNLPISTREIIFWFFFYFSKKWKANITNFISELSNVWPIVRRSVSKLFERWIFTSERLLFWTILFDELFFSIIWRFGCFISTCSSWNNKNFFRS